MSKQKEPTARELALSVLLEVTEKNAKSHLLLRDVLTKYEYLPAQERAQLKRLTVGTLQTLLLLDDLIDRFSKTPTKKMKPVIRNLLRMSCYELLFMDSIPYRATVSEAVRLAERKGFSGLKGFVNGVLRSIVRALPDYALPEDLSLRYSVSDWIVDDWVTRYGREQAEEILKGFSDPPLTVRLCTAKHTKEEILALWETEGVAAAPAGELEGAYILKEPGNLSVLPSFQAGACFVQDLSSMHALTVAAEALNGIERPKGEPYHILDVCGAPGGKSLFFAERLKERGEIVCRDLSAQKVALIEENLRRCGYTNLRTEAFDARSFDPAWEKRADLVLSDLPCSGLGVLGRKPEIRYRKTIEDVQALAALQREILNVCARYVRAGGLLLYSTCTIRAEENEENTKHFLATQLEFSLIKEEQLFPRAGMQDGFYYALFRRDGA